MIEALFVFLFFIGLMLFIYFKVPNYSIIKFPIISTIYSFSLIIGMSLLTLDIVGSPYIHIFFIIFQTIIFIITSIEYYNIKRPKE